MINVWLHFVSMAPPVVQERSPGFICCSQFEEKLLSEGNRMRCVVCFHRTIRWQLFQSVSVGGVLRCVKWEEENHIIESLTKSTVWRLRSFLLSSITGVSPHGAVITPSGASGVGLRAVNQDETLKGCFDDVMLRFPTFSSRDFIKATSASDPS